MFEQTIRAKWKEAVEEARTIAAGWTDRQPTDIEVKRLGELEGLCKDYRGQLDAFIRSAQIQAEHNEARDQWDAIRKDAPEVLAPSRDHDGALRAMTQLPQGAVKFKAYRSPLDLERRMTKLGMSRSEVMKVLSKRMVVTEDGNVVQREFVPNVVGRAVRDEKSGMVKYGDWRRASTGTHRAYVSGTDASGGYTVATLFERTLFDFMDYTGGVRGSGARVLTTGTAGNLELMVVNTHFGPTGTLEGTEIALPSATEDAFTQLTLGAYFYYGLATISDRLIRDSMVDMESFAAQGIARVLVKKTEMRYHKGTGTNMPTGLFNSPPAGQTNETAGSTVLVYDDLLKAMALLEPTYHMMSGGQSWLTHSKTWFGNVLTLKHTDGTYIFPPEARTSADLMRLENAVVRFSAFIDDGFATAGEFPVWYGNMMDAYVIRDVDGIEIMRSDHAYWTTNQIGIKGVVETDGAPLHSNASTFVKVKT